LTNYSSDNVSNFEFDLNFRWLSKNYCICAEGHERNTS